MNVINESTPGSRIGSSIGSGISQTLDMLTNHKLNQVAERHQLANAQRARQQESGALQSLGLPAQFADALSNLEDQNLKRNILSNLGGLGQGQSQGANLFQNPMDKYKQQQIDLAKSKEDRAASEFQQMEARRSKESLAKLGEIGAKTALTKAKTADIAAQQELNRKNQQLRESIAKTDEQIAKAKNDIERQKLQLQKNKMERQINTNEDKYTKQKVDQELKQSVQKLREQTAIEKNNAPYLNDLRPAVINADEIYDLAYEMNKYLKTGSVASGIMGRLELSPKFTWLQGNASRRFDQLGTDLATKVAGQSGIASNFKIKSQKEAKPSLSDDTATQKHGVEFFLKKAKKIKDEGAIANSIIEQNGGDQPKNIEVEINKQLREIQKIPLPLESEYVPGSIIKIGGYRFELDKGGNYWRPLGKIQQEVA